MKLVRAVVPATLSTSVILVSVLTIQLPAHAESWLCRAFGIGCPQTIEGTSPNPPSPPPPPEPIGFEVCNYASQYPLSVAFVTKKRGNFGSLGTGASTTTTSQGWWPVSPNQCRVIYAGNANDVVAIAAQDGTGRVWPESEGVKYCLHPGNGFSFTNEAHYSPDVCRSKGGFTGDFIRVGAASRFYSYSFK